MNFAVLADHSVKIKESKKKNKYLDLAREIKKVIEYKGDGDTDYNWCTWNSCQRFGKGTERVKNQRINWDHTNYSIVVSQNTEESPRDLKRLAVI